MEITLLCNLRCVHCYNFDRQEPYLPMRSTREELSDEEIHRIIDEVRAEGCLFLAFTGGEALVHPGLVSFVEHARSLGTYVRLKSNGVLLTDAKAKELVHAGVSAVDISLYGAAGDDARRVRDAAGRLRRDDRRREGIPGRRHEDEVQHQSDASPMQVSSRGWPPWPRSSRSHGT